MYYITELLNGEWQCYCMVQDGKELWTEKTREKATHSLIQAARILNGSHIREDDIQFFKQENSILESKISKDELDLLEKIRTRHKVVLNFNDPRVKMRITPRECELIQKIREGEIVCVVKHSNWTN